MKITYQGNKRKTEEVLPLWVEMAKDYNGEGTSGTKLTVPEICQKYINEKTGKNYSRSHVYWILRKVQTLPVN